MKKASNARSQIVFIFVLALSVLSACGKSVTGTYSNANGTVVLELKSGGKATITMLGVVGQCTYEADDQQVTLTCEGEKWPFARNQDGSLTGPPIIGLLQKSRS